MNCSPRAWSWRVCIAILAVFVAGVNSGFTQDVPKEPAPGVMRSVELPLEVGETVSRHDLVELLAVDKDYAWAKNIDFRRDIWGLEFRFKPVRMIWVDIPQETGHMRRQLIWYMVYSVTNNGGALHPVPEDDGTYNVESVDKPVLFIPEFVLLAEEFGKAYPDRVIPLALEAINRRESPNAEMANSVTISRTEIPVGETRWGIALWENVDPRVDRFSVFVGGLTNAYRWVDEPGAYKKGDPVGTGRRIARKTLKLNFWRPGDELNENEKEIRYGIPGEVDYEWVYR